jgi:hypothetical protein
MAPVVVGNASRALSHARQAVEVQVIFECVALRDRRRERKTPLAAVEGVYSTVQ